MNSKINEILKEIESKKKELVKEYEKLKDRYDFSFKKWKIIFTEKAKEFNKRYRDSILRYIFDSRIKDILSIPFIWSVLLPVLVLDLFVTVYHYVCFKFLYDIPLVSRKDYIVFDRKHLDYLNIFQKIYCIYCSYVNWFLAYAVEVAGRTEKYWCPIKHAQRNGNGHNWEKYFADYWDAEEFKRLYDSHECFNSIRWKQEENNK